MANDKEIIKRLLAVVQKQQKIITKMAQDPFSHSGLPGDPLDPDIGSPAPAPKPGGSAPKPKPKSAPAPAPAPARGALPPDVKSALDVANLPQLKGNTLVTVNGNTLNIAFNADKIKDRPTDLKNKLNSALGGDFTVGQIIGYNNPNWKPNY